MPLDSTTFASLFSFSRSGTATYLDASGVLQTAADGVARTAAYRYVGGVLTGPSVHLESDAATNLVTYSEDFTDASWAKSNATVTSNSIEAPDGATSADKLVEDTSSGVHQASASASVSASTRYTYSLYMKAGERSWAQFVLGPSTFFGSSSVVASFDLANGVVGTVTSNATALPEATIESIGNGWYRCRLSATTNATSGTGSFFVRTATGDGAVSYTGDGSSGIYIWGAQFEENSIPTSYIPTSGATATRSAETLTIAAAGMPTYTDAICVQLSGTMTYGDTGAGLSSTGGGGEVLFYLWGSGTTFIHAGVSTQTARTGQPEFAQRDGASGLDTVSGTSDYYSPGVNVSFNLASRHGSTFINGAVDGTALTENTTPTAIADLSAADFEVAPNFNGHIDHLLIWNEDIGDTGIEEASQ